ncbi:hypothetical protein SAMN05421837_111297 [Amycolatopsis pretoriensis]|uniref:Uncharacterized protein n=1 Tax=Amycolatopsis pretoriensis TaxID=218821 RepID=A0A1H5RES3_9PSEU|nr:hypothetical protein [Amycolatopsis pretoriensis]SEF36876.1 hypothetical protein SAMN05421837_111297 [Amycolatopsis pretoriensis]
MADAVSLLWYGAAAAGVTESARKALVNRGFGYTLSRHFLTAGIACMAMSLAAGDPMTLDWADQLTGLHNVAIVVHNLLAMLAMVFTAAFLHTLGQLRLPMPGVVTIFVACAAAMVTLYVLAGAHTSFFGSPQNPTLPSQLYSAIYLTYMVGWLAALLLGLTVVAMGEVAGVRGGVILAQLGVAVSLVGLSWRLGVVLHLLFDPHHPPRGTHFAVFTDGVGLVLFIAGSVFAAATRRIFDRRDQRRTQRQEAAIERLWRRVRILLVHRRRPPLTSIQQMVEIEDALLIVDQLIDSSTRSAIRNDLWDLVLLYEMDIEPMATAVEIEIAIAVIVARLSRPTAVHAEGNTDDADTEAWWPETERLPVDDDQRARWLAATGTALSDRRVRRLAKKLGPKPPRR